MIQAKGRELHSKDNLKENVLEEKTQKIKCVTKQPTIIRWSLSWNVLFILSNVLCCWYLPSVTRWSWQEVYLDKGRSWDVHNSAQAWPDLKIIQIEVCFRLTSILVQGAEHDGPLNALLPQRKAHPVIRCKEWKMLKWCLIWIPKHHNCWNVIFLCKSYCTSIR